MSTCGGRILYLLMNHTVDFVTHTDRLDVADRQPRLLCARHYAPFDNTWLRPRFLFVFNRRKLPGQVRTEQGCTITQRFSVALAMQLPNPHNIIALQCHAKTHKSSIAPVSCGSAAHVAYCACPAVATFAGHSRKLCIHTSEEAVDAHIFGLPCRVVSFSFVSHGVRASRPCHILCRTTQQRHTMREDRSEVCRAETSTRAF